MWGFSPKTFIYLLDIEFLSVLCRSSNESKKSTPCIVPFSSEPPRHPSMKMKFKAASKRTDDLSCGVKAKRHFGHYERLSDPLLSKPRSRFLTFNSQVKESIQKKFAIVQDSFIALQPCQSMCKLKKTRWNFQFQTPSFSFESMWCP